MMQKEELERLISIFMLMNETESRYFIFNLRRRERGFSNIFAAALGVELDRFERVVIARILEHFENLRAGDPVFECKDCGGTTEAEGLRWDKLNKGEAVTVSIDHSGKPDALAWLTDELIMREWFKPWTVNNPVVKFELLTAGKGDAHIQWAPIDGPGNTLAFVWQPRNGEFMDTAGEIVGDMTCDSTERSYPEALVHEAGKHEVGHVLGIGHLESTIDVMYPSARGEQKPLSKNDLAERKARYPQSKKTQVPA